VTVPGRLEPVGGRPLVLFDGAHNPAAAEALAESLPEIVAERPLVGVIGVLDDKDATGILRPLLALMRRAVFTEPSPERSLPAATLESLTGQLDPGLGAEVVRRPSAALERAKELAGPDGAVLVTGSLHLVADLVRPRAARASSR
jgi:dihydrofolate synthase / folylpolyglutamate synthase